MTESIGMDIYVKATGANQTRVSLDSLTRSAEKLEKATGTYTDTQGRLRDSNGRFVKSNNDAATSLGKVQKGAQGASNATDRLAGSSNSAGTAMGALKKATIGLLSFATVKQAINMADSMSSLGSQVRFVTQSLEEANAVQEALFSISNKTYTTLEATTTLYTRTARALKDAGKSQADLLNFTEAVNNAMRIGGASANEQANALLQLSQALGSGVLQGDEFRSIAENAPILLDLVAKELGVVRGEVKALASEGKVTSQVLFNASINAREQLSKDAARMPVTFGQSLQVMGNSLKDLTDKALNSTGIMTTIAGGVVFLADNLEYVLVPAVGVTGIALTGIFGMATKATLAFNAALLANPIGLLVGGIAAATTALYLFRNEIVLNKELGLALGDVVGGAFDNIKEAGTTAWGSINTTFKEMYEAVTDKAADFEVNISDVFMTFARVARTPFNITINTVVSVFKLLRGVVTNFVDFMATAGKSIAFYLLSPFEWAVNGIQSLLEGLSAGIASIPGFSGFQLEFERFDFASQFSGEVDKFKGMVRDGLKEVGREFQSVLFNDPVGDMFGRVFYGEGAQDRKDKRVESLKGKTNLGGSGNNGASSKGGSGGLDLVNAYTKKLMSLSDETAKLRSLNDQLAKTGYESQYNAVSSITHELESQSSVLSKLGESQKQILLLKAGELDAQKQINAILNFGTDNTKRLDDMMFEISLMGRSKEQIDALRYARDLENQAKLLSIGMTKENIALLSEETQKYLDRYAATQRAKEEKENSIGGGIEQGMLNYVTNLGTMRDQFADATESALGHMEGFLVSFATTGKASFNDMATSILQDISRMMIRMAMMQAVQSAMGFLFPGSTGSVAYPYQAWVGGLIPEYDKGGKVIDFSGGGFTGDGGKFEPKGIVHGGEFVMSKAAVNTLGIDYLERLHSSAKRGTGYADGGIVGNRGPSHTAPRGSNNNAQEQVFNITVYNEVKEGEKLDEQALAKFVMGIAKSESEKTLQNAQRPGGRLR